MLIKKFISLFIFTGACLFSNACSSDTDNSSLMTSISYEDWDKKLSTYSPNIVVVDMWATWCASCIERFPDIIKLHQEFKNKSVVFASMNLDDHEDHKAVNDAEKFLYQMNADFDHYHMNENLMIAFDKLGLISIPAVIIYDKHGDEVNRFTGDNPNKQFTKKDIEEALNKLISSN